MNPNAAAGQDQRSWWQRRVLAPILTQLRQGSSPRMIAVTIAAGAVIGILPILGTTTLLCAVIAVWFRLNQPIIQLVNYFIYPLQIALLFPFYRAGEFLFRQPPVPLVSIEALTERFWAGPGQFFIDYGMLAVYGLVVWLLAAPLLFGLLYLSLHAPMRTLAQRIEASRRRRE